METTSSCFFGTQMMEESTEAAIPLAAGRKQRKHRSLATPTHPPTHPPKKAELHSVSVGRALEQNTNEERPNYHRTLRLDRHRNVHSTQSRHTTPRITVNILNTLFLMVAF